MKRAIFRSCFALALVSVGFGCGKPTQVAPSEATLTVTADPLRIDVFGTSVITIIARKSDGTPVNEGTEILVTTTLGSVDRVVLVDDRGVATAELRGDGTVGMAEVEASSGAAAPVAVEVQVGALPASLFLNASPQNLPKDIPESGATIKLSATVQDDLFAPIKSALVTFSSERGVLESGGAPIETGKRGIAKDRLKVTPGDLVGLEDGIFIISAFAGEEVFSDVEISVSGFPADIFLQPIPSSVPETGGVIDLVATVLDDAGDPSEDVVVVFVSEVGSLPGGARRTDSQGVARDQLVVTAADLDLPVGQTSFVVTASVGGEAAGGDVSDTANITIQRGAVSAVISKVEKTLPIDPSDLMCDDTRIRFTSSSTGDVPIELFWDFGDGTTGTDVHVVANGTVTIDHDYGQKSGEFTVTLTATNVLGSDQTEQVIDLATFFPKPPCP